MKADYIDDVREKALAMLEQADALDNLCTLDIPGRFVFSPPHSRLTVGSLEELHEARVALRKYFNWKDTISNKFFSCGNVIVTYEPDESVKTPLPFSLWIENIPEKFPKEIIGDCELIEVTEKNYYISCPVKGAE